MANKSDSYNEVEYILKNIKGLISVIKELKIDLNVYKDQEERFHNEIDKLNYDINKCEFPIKLVKRSMNLLDSRQQRIIIGHYFENIAMCKLSIGTGFCKETIKIDNKNAVGILIGVLYDCIPDINYVIDKYVTKGRKNKYYQYSVDNKIVRIWYSADEFESLGFNKGSIQKCCNGKVKTYRGYKWSRYPL